ncbi:helix-turn-helix domain-containing protein [Streptomyces durocortorensis]|uniref:Helix-turn-helix domain-containing protein n=1 Tax=Streptomyces durocortorensis TaxID=2811104 RepID=A0ABS2I245_9ACTN|nr:helix-turn-helix transcriptional regulator [Streptomyces durocortorensis]MBM7057286.1 helix-turn-helix domain-containing protein [Streptomyces durocortorensis]
MSGDAEGAARAVLAERLSALREESGRTYASLARRIGVSGSTLHRYCTGRTVPAEFAPVERLARLCGAPAGEREALHRLWLLADGERLERQGVVEAAGAEEAGAEEAGAEEAGAGASVDAGMAGAPVDEAVASGQSDVSGRWGSGRRVLRWCQGRRYGQGLGVVAAAVLVLALVAAFGRPWSSGPERRPAVAQQPSGPPADAPEPSASLTPGKPQGTASGSRDGTPSGSTRPTTSPGGGPRDETLPRASGPSSASEAGRAPFTWTGDDHVWKNGCDHAYLVDRAPAAVPPPPVEADAAPWAGALGAVHAGETGVRITLQGRDERAVVLESLRIRVVERRSPAPGRVYRMSSGCGGSLTPRMFDVDLDVPRPVARSVAGNDSGEPIEAVAFPYRVSVTDPEVFLITGRTAGCDCDWFAELSWSSGGRSGTVRIDDGGRPFRTSGVGGRPVLDYDTADRRWVSAEPSGETGADGEAETAGEGVS